MDIPPPVAFTRPVDAPLDRAPAGALTRWSGLNCSILFFDVAGFGDPSRDDEDRQVVRDVVPYRFWTATELDAAIRLAGGLDAVARYGDFGTGEDTVALTDPEAWRMITILRGA